MLLGLIRFDLFEMMNLKLDAILLKDLYVGNSIERAMQIMNNLMLNVYVARWNIQRGNHCSIHCW